MDFFYSFLKPNSLDAGQSNGNTTNTSATTEENYDFNWTTSLIPRPLSYTTSKIKNQLPVMEYKISGDHDDECVVCLTVMEENQLARELQNCSHIFHKQCLDENNVTCPLCRADLVCQIAGFESTETCKWRE